MTDPFSSFPPDMAAELRRRQAQHILVQDDLERRIRDLILSLTKEQATTLMNMVTMWNSIITGPGAEAQAHFMGALEWHIRSTWDVCPHCGNNHDDDALAHMLGPDGAKIEEKPADDGDRPRTVEEQNEALRIFQQAASGQIPNTEVKPWTQPTFDDVVADQDEDALAYQAQINARENALEYGVYFSESGNIAGEVICIGCATVFSSLEDRMKRDPGAKGCSTCQQKAKWG